MSVTIDGPADFPALFRSADRESQRAQRSYLTSLRVRLGSLVVAAFGGALTLTTAGGFQVGGGLAFSPSLVRWAPSSFSRRPARSQRGTRVGPLAAKVLQLEQIQLGIGLPYGGVHEGTEVGQPLGLGPCARSHPVLE
jgi:hypothetical protein